MAKAECRLSLAEVFQPNKVIPPELIIVNDVDPFNKLHGAFHIWQLAKIAPQKTIFIGVIDPEVGTDRKGIVVQTEDNNYFIGPDNGILYPAVESKGINGIWEIDKEQFPNSSNTFHGRDIFSKVAAYIACGMIPDSIGFSIDNMVQLRFQKSQIVHIDRFGNLNIFDSNPNGTNSIVLSNGLTIPIVKTFEDVEIGQPLAYLGSSGLLEIAIREGNASKSLGYKIGDCLEIQGILDKI